MDVVLEVQGMSCSNCEKSITESLKNLRGVNKIDIHLDEGKVDVDYDHTVVSLEEICDQIEDLGFDVNR